MNVNSFDWLVSRGSGFAAFALLTAAVVFGLALSLRFTSQRWPRAVTNDVHRSLTNLALWMTGLHMVTLLIDSQSGFGLRELLVPFASGYRPVATSLGILAMFATVAVVVSTKLRGRIGYRRWRRLHGIAFAAYAAALFHGLFAGTDTGVAWSTFVYLASATLVGGLILMRVLPARAPDRQAGVAPTPPAATAAPPRPRERDLPPLSPRPAREPSAGLPPLRP
jgi:sulfoxide reductase heme-binding subunit YedZ